MVAPARKASASPIRRCASRFSRRLARWPRPAPTVPATSAQTVQEAVDAFGSEVDLYLDGGPTQGHVSSTVVKADPYARDGIEILREGVIAQNVIRKALHLNGGGLGA